MFVDFNKFPITHEHNAVWAKISAISEAFTEYPSTEWVWWLDVDAIIMTPHLDLYGHLLSPAALRTRLIEGDLIIPSGDVPGNSDHPILTHPILTGEVDPQIQALLT